MNPKHKWALGGLTIVLAILFATVLFLTQDRTSESRHEPLASETDVGEPLPLLNTRLSQSTQQIAKRRLNPLEDGWETEAVAEQAKKQLLHLGETILGADVSDALNKEVAESVESSRLRPATLTEVFSETAADGKLTVASRAGSKTDLSPIAYSGHKGLRQALADLAEPFRGASDVHVHVKVIRVECTPSSASTTSYFEASGKLPSGSLQQRATWHCKWKRSGGNLLLESIRSAKFEEASVAGHWLVDCTLAVLDNNRSFREQLSVGHHDWLSRLHRSHGIGMFTRSGIALGDVNGDGLDDVYVCQPGGLPNRLFIHQSDGTAIDQSAHAEVDWLDHSSSALILDLDNDGDQDLVVATTAGLLLLSNQDGRFRLQTTLAIQDTDTQSISAADYDQDGDLDLYFCFDFVTGTPDGEFVYHDANDGAPNRLYRNDIASNGEWKFTDVTEQVGLDEDNRRHSLACAWEDYDNDGDQDLYVANDYGQNCLYQNNGGTFKNVAVQANAVDSASGMSISWGDYDQDGWMDAYVANMFSSAGSRITRQAKFMPGSDDQLRNAYSRFAKGNTLLKNDGEGQFVESESAGVEMGRWAWSSVFADLNNDSRDDLLVANGYITTDDSGDL